MVLEQVFPVKGGFCFGNEWRQSPLMFTHLKIGLSCQYANNCDQRKEIEILKCLKTNDEATAVTMVASQPSALEGSRDSETAEML